MGGVYILARLPLMYSKIEVKVCFLKVEELRYCHLHCLNRADLYAKSASQAIIYAGKDRVFGFASLYNQLKFQTTHRASLHAQDAAYAGTQVDGRFCPV